MITNFKQQSRKDDLKLLAGIILAFLLIAWMCCPPGNKFLQISFWGNNTKYFVSKLVNPAQAQEYIFHRNNAIYLAKMYPKDKAALKEMDLAIDSLPQLAPERELKILYKERGDINLFLGNKKAALRDFVRGRDLLGYDDLLKIAMLFKEEHQYREAMSFCLLMTELNEKAYTGYSCKAEIYNSIGRPDVALNIWNQAIELNRGNARMYAERAKVRKALGDLTGYNEDVKTAKEYSPVIDIDDSIINETLNPKILTLSIRKS